MMEQYIHSDLHFMEILIIPDKCVTVFNLQEVLLLLKRHSGVWFSLNLPWRFFFS